MESGTQTCAIHPAPAVAQCTACGAPMCLACTGLGSKCEACITKDQQKALAGFEQFNPKKGFSLTGGLSNSTRLIVVVVAIIGIFLMISILRRLVDVGIYGRP